MKAFVLFFVLGVSSYAQKSFPDTLYLFNNNIVPCLITEYSDSRIYFSFSQNNSETLISEAIDKYTVEGFGIVYTRDKGLIVNQELLEEFIETRREKNNLQYAIDKELARISQYNSESNNKDAQILENIQHTNFNKDKLSRWGFGFLIVPYYATNVYFIENINYSPIVSSYIENEFNLIASMSYSFNSNIKATVELGYSASSLEDKNENYTTINNNLIESRTVTKEELQLFDFILG
ncbi:MAG: hypothetical protein OQJ81_06940, partial [Melioribacteraceae bacterium]|nr:hypothetical protein [Melioribacteraceae bacterium]